MTTQRMLTGDRPTGKLHLGHYVGSIANRVKLHQSYESFFLIADLHMLTTRNTRQDIAQVAQNARDLVLDALAAGIEPEHATFYLQSADNDDNDLIALLQNLVTVPRLERIPSLKDMARDAGKEEMPFSLLGYPVLQAADILGVKGNVVPVGKDNTAHVEVTREIARRVNYLYGEVFPIPELISGEVPVLVGTDGQAKMSKSLGNVILLSDGPAEVHQRVMSMYTDPKRIRADVPGTVQGNPVFVYHDVFNADRADVEVKERLAAAVNRLLDPMRERRARFEDDKGLVDQLIVEGTERTRREVQQTVLEARKAMGLTATFNQIRRRAERSHWRSTSARPGWRPVRPAGRG